MAGEWTVLDELMNGQRMAAQLREKLAGVPLSLELCSRLDGISDAFSRAVGYCAQRSSTSTEYSCITDAATPTSAPPGGGRALAKKRRPDDDEPRRLRNNYRRRANFPESEVRVVRQAAEDDGYSWRKYGQKKIDGKMNPRCYYRCTYKRYRSCPATKQVQRADDDPEKFEITYLGKHRCEQLLLPSPASGGGGTIIDFEKRAVVEPAKHAPPAWSPPVSTLLDVGELPGWTEWLDVWDDHVSASPVDFHLSGTEAVAVSQVYRNGSSCGND